MDRTADCEELQLLFSQAALEGGRKSRWPAAILVVGVGCRGGCGWLCRWRLIKTGWGPRTGKTDGRVWCSINTTRHSPAATGCSSGVFIARTPGAAVVDRCAGYWWSAGVQDRRADLTVKVSKAQINRLKVKITTTKWWCHLCLRRWTRTTWIVRLRWSLVSALALFPSWDLILENLCLV